MSGRRSRDKGSRTERAIVRFLQNHGFAAEKISGMYRPGPDLSVPVLGRDLRVEAKSRSHGFAQLYSWLVDRDLLIVKSDRAEPLVILRLGLATEIAVAAEKGRQRRHSRAASGKTRVHDIQSGSRWPSLYRDDLALRRRPHRRSLPE
jgi:hypothetical protein